MEKLGTRENGACRTNHKESGGKLGLRARDTKDGCSFVQVVRGQENEKAMAEKNIDWEKVRGDKILFESLDEGEVQALVEGANDWLSQWFAEIRSLSPNDVDNERLTWIRCTATCLVDRFLQF
ncbi:hypothetical protein L195_g037216 [Trifolium pratense]|uniref:Uncharacterized protein n=1 Tax=Trifolium pratense TaxID=57577 RepID=A0A2K3LRQ9_TRIPR|nr:hypothetical protein L195_g037216 [Trifolium pratense]